MALNTHNRRRAMLGVLPHPDGIIDSPDKGYIWGFVWPQELRFIFDQVIANLKTISIANGYSFDIGGRVHGWWDIPYDDDLLPAINVRDPLNIVEEPEEEFHRYEFDIILLESGNTAPGEVRERAGDVIKAFGLINELPQVEAVTFLGSEKDIQKGAKSFSVVRLRFAITFYVEYFMTGERIEWL